MTLADTGMARMMGGTAAPEARMDVQVVPARVSAGRVTLVVTNRGWRTHELVVLPLAAGRAVGALIPGRDGKVDEVGSLGEASRSCGSDAGTGILPGAVGWTTLRLPRGRYELVCNLADHYAEGMHAELAVT